MNKRLLRKRLEEFAEQTAHTGGGGERAEDLPRCRLDCFLEEYQEGSMADAHNGFAKMVGSYSVAGV